MRTISAAAFLVVLILMNAMVLLGQVWPEGAPPFAKTANIAFLGANLVYLVTALFIRGSKLKSPGILGKTG